MTRNKLLICLFIVSLFIVLSPILLATAGPPPDGPPPNGPPPDGPPPNGGDGPPPPAPSFEHAQTLIFLAVFFGFGAYGLYYTHVLNKIPYIRKLAALEAIDEGIGRAVEEGRRAHFGLPNANPSSPAALAGLSIMEYFATKAAQAELPVTYTTAGNVIGLMIMEGTLRETYAAEGKIDLYDNPEFFQLRLFAVGRGPGVSDTYALALSTHMMRENTGFNCLGVGLPKQQLLVGEANQIVNSFSVCSYPIVNKVEWAIIGFDYVLLLQESFAAGAILSKDPKQLAHIFGLDIATWAVLAFVVICTAAASVIGPLTNILVG